MGYGTISTSPGTITDLRLTPVITNTTLEAIQTYGPQKRKCYTEDEIELTYLPKYLGYTYTFTNCLFESTYEKIFDTCSCETRNHVRVVHEMQMQYDMDHTYAKPIRKPTCVGNQLKCANDIFSRISENMVVYDNFDQRTKECQPSCTDQVNQISYSKTSYPARLMPMFEDFCLLFVKLMTQCNRPTKRKVLNATYPSLCAAILDMENEFKRQKLKIEDEIRANGAAKDKKKVGRPPPPTRDPWVSRYCDVGVSAWTTLLDNYTDSIKFEREMRKYEI